jgi:hypothetical protein
LTPPRPELDWTTISRYNYVEELTFLTDCRNDIRTEPWANPVIREAMKTRLRVKRAREELTRCNIESRRLLTHINDERHQHRQLLDQLRITSHPLHLVIEEYCLRREGINNYILQQLEKLFALPGFSGDRTIGRRVGIQNVGNNNTDCIGEIVPSVLEPDNDEDSDEEDSENIQVQIGGLVDYVSSLALL